MLKFYGRYDDSTTHFTYKCDYGDGTIRFFTCAEGTSDRILERDACYWRETYKYIMDADSIEEFLQQHKLLNLLEE